MNHLLSDLKSSIEGIESTLPRHQWKIKELRFAGNRTFAAFNAPVNSVNELLQSKEGREKMIQELQSEIDFFGNIALPKAQAALPVLEGILKLPSNLLSKIEVSLSDQKALEGLVSLYKNDERESCRCFKALNAILSRLSVKDKDEPSNAVLLSSQAKGLSQAKVEISDADLVILEIDETTALKKP